MVIEGHRAVHRQSLAIILAMARFALVKTLGGAAAEVASIDSSFLEHVTRSQRASPFGTLLRTSSYTSSYCVLIVHVVIHAHDITTSWVLPDTAYEAYPCLAETAPTKSKKLSAAELRLTVSQVRKRHRTTLAPRKETQGRALRSSHTKLPS